MKTKNNAAKNAFWLLRKNILCLNGSIIFLLNTISLQFIKTMIKQVKVSLQDYVIGKFLGKVKKVYPQKNNRNNKKKKV